MMIWWPPAYVRYSDDLPEGTGGQAVRCVVTIRRKYQNDEGLLQHELTHIWQWWLTLFLHSILYNKVRRYRLWSEVQAYRVQMRYGMKPADAALRLLNPKYDLGLNFEEALELVTK